MTEEVKKTNRASRKRVAAETTQPEETSNTEEDTQPEETSNKPTSKDGREIRKMPSGATALV